jgi:hypothetical protein
MIFNQKRYEQLRNEWYKYKCFTSQKDFEEYQKLDLERCKFMWCD